MSGCRDDTAEVRTMFHPSGGVRQRIYKQPPATVENGAHLTGPPGKGSAVNGHLLREAADGENECSYPPLVTSRNVFCRLILVIALSLTLFAVGTLLFIGGFFLSRENLPYISNGRVIPFPPLFPHLDPARLQLNREEGLYYVEKGIPRGPRSTSEHVDADGAPQPLHLEQFTNPTLAAVSSEPEPCQTENCGSSWVSVTPYDRVVVLLIDALRFDFLLWDPEASRACEDNATKECAGAPSGLRPFYRNRLPFAHDLLRRSDAELQRFLFSLINGNNAPKKAVNSTTAMQKDVNETKLATGASEPQAGPTGLSSIDSWGGNRFTRLYIFEADPPTATTQRLTGLATGSMPSFFTVRETFSASAVNVDSLPLQFKAANKTSVAIGDDTWDRTFGHLLTRVHAFPSLNIQDLNTVDDRVAAELPREFSKSDWIFLVGHVLGVDHVGHAAVLDSALMHKKLTDMNGMIKNMLKMIFDHSSSAASARTGQTLFLVFGDHGMTEAGSHGGGTSEEVDAGLFSFSTLPAMLSPRTAQMLSPATRLFAGRLPTYLQSHGAFRDSSGRRRVASAALDAASPTAALGYGSRRVSQVGLAPTLSLLLGLPIPFNSMGRIIADIVPSIASFVQECAPEAQAESLSAFKCGANDGKSCGETESEVFAIAQTVRCSDVAYLTQLHHIVAWQQHQAIMTLAAVTGNGAVLADPQFAAAKVKWLRLYSELDKEIKALPEAAHLRLTSGSSAHTFTRKKLDATISFPADGFETADAELLSHISRLSQTPAGGGKSGEEGETHVGSAKEVAAGAASALPSLVPYLRACADFSQEVWQASVRQLCTFNIVFMVCGILMTLSSVIILGLAAWALRNPFRGSVNPTFGARTACSLPELATIARWLRTSACIGGGTWAAGWALLEICKHVRGDYASELDVFLWRQLPALCLTGVLCSAVVPFARSTLSLPAGSSAQRHLLRESCQGEDEPPLSGEQAAGGLWKLLQEDLCPSRLWLRLFNGGRFHCYVALFMLCIIPFSDCFVEGECSIVKFLINIYCISAGLAAFATPSTKGEKEQIVAACAALSLCVRIGSAFDPFAGSADKEGANGWPLQVDSTSASAILMFCMYCVVGMKELPLVSRLFGSESDSGRYRESKENSRFRIASFHPLKERKGARSCTFERDVILTQGAIAVLWFAFPHDSNSQQSASEGSQRHRGGYNTVVDEILVSMWSGVVYPFKVLDAAGAAFFGRLTPPGPWLYTAPRCLLRVIPSQLRYGGQVKLVPLLNVLLPWVIYVFTAGLWMRLVLILCRMKNRKSELGTQQLRNANEQRTAMGREFESCSNAHLATDKATPVAQALQKYTGPAVAHATALMIGKIAFGILMGVTFKHFCSLLSLTLLRHHLFIWHLFAVKFLFDTTAACVMYVLIVLTFFIVGIGVQRTPKVVLHSA
ncbi:hypothetical protein, conserved [Eimeria brunetti]|uniref:GPI ethanolamine phosphate transferase 3 n=1 Tax=Eimeria brunetti TaxID=51314 RepID=U6LNF0_9EIME|nr:hypothetical protein, conserved [Eimeria brunetti]